MMAGPRAPDRCARAGLLAAVLMLVAAGASGRPGTSPELAANLAHFSLALGTTTPYRFRLRYHGPRMPFRGRVCYAFAGYNETCTDPDIRWLTPATVIELWAPGGVPRDLLGGYTMLVRFPALSDRRYAFTLERHPGGHVSR